eukprot:13296328-Alexandrium_andersonii.AAC.1
MASGAAAPSGPCAEEGALRVGVGSVPAEGAATAPAGGGSPAEAEEGAEGLPDEATPTPERSQG